jgi:predicted RecB family endonuclease
VVLGVEAEPLSFYQPLRNGGDQPSQIRTVGVNGYNVRSHSDECNIETIETEEEMPQNNNTVRENAVDEKVQCFTAKFESLHQAFGTSEVSIDKLLSRMARSRMQTSGKILLQLLVVFAFSQLLCIAGEMD